MTDMFFAFTSVTLTITGCALYLLLIKSVLHSIMPLKENNNDN